MNLKKYIWLAALPMIFTSCQEDMLVENLQQGITTLTASMDKAPSDSRAQIVLNGSNTAKEIFHWNAGDKFTLFQLGDESNAWTEHVFSISSTYSDNEPTAQADFSTSSALTPGSDFVAFYPARTPDAKGGIQLSIDNVLPTNDAASWKSYFMNNMFMKTRVGAVGPTSADTQVNFEQLCGIIRIKYTNASKTDRTFERIGVNGRWTTGRYYMVSDAETFDERDSSIGWLGVEFENKATVRAGETQNFYILYFSNGVDGEVEPMSRVIVDLDVANKTTLVTPAKELPQFKAGECYWLNITDTGAKLLWTNDQQGGGNQPSDMLEVFVSDYDGLKNALEQPANETIIFFEDDIELEAPLEISNTTHFEMNGKTLSFSDEYKANGESAVFNVNARLTLGNGTIIGKESTTKLHDYYFALNGEYVRLQFSGATLNTGSAVANAIFMDDDYLRMNSINLKNEEITSAIVTEGNAIHFVGKTPNRIYQSTINGNITGDVKVETEYDRLNAEFIFETGTVNGDLITNFTGGAKVADCILLGDAFEAPGTGWSAAGRFVRDQDYTINELADLKEAFSTPQTADEMTFIYFKSDIVLDEPLTANKPIQIMMNGRTLTLSDSFNWGSAEAAITVASASLNIDNGIIIGSMTSATGKYLIKYTGSDFGIYENASLVTNGVQHALQIIDARANIDNATIHVQDDGEGVYAGYAVNVLAEKTFAQLFIRPGSSIYGHVGFTADYQAKEPDLNVISVRENCQINGDLKLTGEYKSDVEVNFRDAFINGAGWSDILFARLQENFKNHGGAGEEILSLNDQTLTFTVGTTREGRVNFHARRLEGAGTIKFVNNGEDPVTLYLDIEEFLSASVEFEFEGEFRKIIHAKTDRLKEFFEMAKGSDQIFLTLPNDMILGEQIVIDSSMQWSDGSENSAPQGHLCLRLAGHTLTYESNVPAIVLQGGFFRLEGTDKYESATGTIKTNTEFFQVGAAADASNNNICLMVDPFVTFDTEHKTWVYVNGTESATAHKDVEIFLHSETLTTPEEKQAKVRVEESYKGSVDIKG